MPITHKKKRSKHPQTERGGMLRAIAAAAYALTRTPKGTSKVGPAPTPKNPFDTQKFWNILSIIANNNPYQPIEFTAEQLKDPSFQEYKLNYAKIYYNRIKNNEFLINYYETHNPNEYEEMNTIFNYALYRLNKKVAEEQRQQKQFAEEQAKEVRFANTFASMQIKAKKKKTALNVSIVGSISKIKIVEDLIKAIKTDKTKTLNEILSFIRNNKQVDNSENKKLYDEISNMTIGEYYRFNKKQEFEKKVKGIKLLILKLQNDIDILKDNPEYSELIKDNEHTIEILKRRLTEILPEDELNILTLPTAPQHSPEFGKVGGKREPRRTKTSSKTPKSESSTRPSTRTVRTASAAAIGTTRRSRLKRKLPYSASGFGVTLVSAGILNADINTMKPPFSENITQEIINDYANRYRTRILDNSLLQNYYNDHEENLEKENRHIYNFALNIYLHPERYHGNNK
uniref:Uncharacterized protein n=1 Tax=viral metagenome TaxID=1070528 RepID=A0A6C0KUP0_9ZZZZ